MAKAKEQKPVEETDVKAKETQESVKTEDKKEKQHLRRRKPKNAKSSLKHYYQNMILLHLHKWHTLADILKKKQLSKNT